VNEDSIVAPEERILVTGSSGFIGLKVVERLLEIGCRNLRCFVRPSSRLDRLRELLDRHAAANGAELIIGDLLSRADCRRAAEGVSVVYHLAAGFDKSFAGAFMNSALATRNLVEAILDHGRPKRFVNVSSFAVYSNLSIRANGVLDETCPLEDRPQERFDAYAFGKLKQEQIVREYGRRFDLPFVILRPGTVFGPGKKDLSGRVGIGTFGVFIQVDGSNLLPLSFVDNCADAIVLAGRKPGVDGETFNVVDDDLLTSGQFLRAYRRRAGRFLSIRVPYRLANALSRIWEGYSRRSKGQLPPAFNRRRCAAEWKRHRFSNQKLREKLGWRPRVDMETAMARFLEQFNPKN